MTTSHLHDEQLSAHLDGEAGREEPDHLRTCQDCGARLARLEAVATLLSEPVTPPPAAAREAAVAAARAAWAAERAGDLVVGADPGAPAGSAAPGPAHRGAALGTVVPIEDGRRRMPRWALPAAAAAAALLLAVPILASRDEGGGGETAATADRSTAAAGAEVASTNGGDLGDQSDSATLSQIVLGALARSANSGDPTATATPAAPALTGPTVDEAVPGAGAAGSTAVGSDREAAVKTAPDPSCAATARTTYGQGLGPLLYAAVANWQGTPAEVLAYRLADVGAPGLDHRVLVMAREDCRLLVVQSF